MAPVQPRLDLRTHSGVYGPNVGGLLFYECQRLSEIYDHALRLEDIIIRYRPTRL